MKVLVSKTITLPLLYGNLVSLVVAGGLSVFVFFEAFSSPVVSTIIAVGCILLLAIVPALRRGAWVYTNARKYHTAEYFYELGNGAEVEKAVVNYESKVQKAVGAWLKRKLLKNSFGVVPVSFFVFILAGNSWYQALFSVIFILLMVIIATYLGMWTMLLSARRLCYDKFGNLK